MSLFRREKRDWAAEPYVPPFPGYSPTGVVPTMDRALQVSAVWACVRLLADSVSMMPLTAYTLRQGVRVPQSNPPLLKQPSADATMPEWIYMTVVALMLRGNSYGRIVRRDFEDNPVQIELLNPDDVRCRTDANGLTVYDVGKGLTLTSRDVFHLRAFRIPGSSMGLSPIQYAARTINTEAAVADFAYDFFRNGAHPSAILHSDVNFTPDQAKQIKDRFMAATTGREPAVLSGGLQYGAIQVNPEESQFLATQQYGVTQIARIFGVPPEMIGGESANSMTYANVEQRGIDFLTYTVQPWLTRLESALSALLPGQRHVRFDTSALTRTDYETLMKATAIGIASKQMTQDEARAKRDEPPLTKAQRDELAALPFEVSLTGLPRALKQPGTTAPGAFASDDSSEGEPAA